VKKLNWNGKQNLFDAKSLNISKQKRGKQFLINDQIIGLIKKQAAAKY